MDELILKRLKESPEHGLELLMERYMGLVYTIAHDKLHTTCSKEDIEECVSEIFYEVYRNRSTIAATQGTLKGFIAVIAKRRAINRFHKNHHQHFFNASEEELQNVAATMPDDSPATALDNKETHKALIEAIHSLGEPDSTILIRKYYFGQPSKEIAIALQLKQNTVDKKVSRGLAKLKQWLKGVL
ncbi:sigma-70 family RNA polymerase sigma factor [Paenibacillaceae bacterium]|nr:sigma-70 family RNA polymerase sigma factor [Paenibacillaceae bacterium]